MTIELILLYGDETASAYTFDVERYEILDNFTGLEDITKIDEPIKNLLAIQFFEKEGENSMFVVLKGP